MKLCILLTHYLILIEHVVYIKFVISSNFLIFVVIPIHCIKEMRVGAECFKKEFGEVMLWLLFLLALTIIIVFPFTFNNSCLGFSKLLLSELFVYHLIVPNLRKGNCNLKYSGGEYSFECLSNSVNRSTKLIHLFHLLYFTHVGATFQEIARVFLAVLLLRVFCMFYHHNSRHRFH